LFAQHTTARGNSYGWFFCYQKVKNTNSFTFYYIIYYNKIKDIYKKIAHLIKGGQNI